jgi:hypothetical protein
VLYLITFITSIPALLLFQPVLDDPVGYIASAGEDNRILFGALLELLLIIANIGTAVGGFLQGIATIPEALLELFLGIYCTVKGFRPSSPILRADTREDRMATAPAVSSA